LGYLSDRIGQANLAGGLILISLVSMIGLWQLPAILAIPCLLIVLLCDSGLTVTLNAAASGAAVHAERPHLYMGVYATATDLGSALGPLFALSLGQMVGFSTLYLSIGVLCCPAVGRMITVLLTDCLRGWHMRASCATIGSTIVDF
jgi:MFS family permease